MSGAAPRQRFWGVVVVVALLPLGYGAGVLAKAVAANEMFLAAATAEAPELVRNDLGAPVGYRTDAGEEVPFTEDLPDPVWMLLMAESGLVVLKAGAVGGGLAGFGMGMLLMAGAVWLRWRVRERAL